MKENQEQTGNLIILLMIVCSMALLHFGYNLKNKKKTKNMALHSRDVAKLITAGYTIIRADNENLKIKHKNLASKDWSTLEKGFKSKAELRRKMDELLKISRIIED